MRIERPQLIRQVSNFITVSFLSPILAFFCPLVFCYFVRLNLHSLYVQNRAHALSLSLVVCQCSAVMLFHVIDTQIFIARSLKLYVYSLRLNHVTNVLFSACQACS